MKRFRAVMISVGLPLVLVAVVIWALRPERPEYVMAAPTVVTVTDTGGPAVLHAPETIYPAAALRERVEGMVKLHVKIDAGGRVVKADAVSGPAVLVQAARDTLLQYQYVAEATEADVLFPFSLAHPGARTFTVPEPLQRVTPAYYGRVRGTVRVVAIVNPDGRVESVRPVSGPKELVRAAVDSVKLYQFRPMLRDGKAGHGTAVVDVPFY